MSVSHCSRCGRSHDSWDWLCPTCKATEERERIERETREHNERLAEEAAERQQEAERTTRELLEELDDRQQERFEREQADREAAQELAQQLADEQREAWEEETERRREDLANAHCLRAERMREQAQTKLRAGMPEDAIKRLRKALEEDDSNYDIYETLSEAYWTVGDKERWTATVRKRIIWLPYSAQASNTLKYARLLEDALKDPALLSEFSHALRKHASDLPAYHAYAGLLSRLISSGLSNEAKSLLDALPSRSESNNPTVLLEVANAVLPHEELRATFVEALRRLPRYPQQLDSVCALVRDLLARGCSAGATALVEAMVTEADTLERQLLRAVVRQSSTGIVDVTEFSAHLSRIGASGRAAVLQQFDATLSVIGKHLPVNGDLERELRDCLRTRYRDWIPEIRRDYVALGTRFGANVDIGTAWPKACGWMAAVSAWMLMSAILGNTGAVLGIPVGVCAWFAAKAATRHGLRQQNIRKRIEEFWANELNAWSPILRDSTPFNVSHSRSPAEFAGVIIASVFTALLIIAVAASYLGNQQRISNVPSTRVKGTAGTMVKRTEIGAPVHRWSKSYVPPDNACGYFADPKEPGQWRVRPPGGDWLPPMPFSQGYEKKAAEMQFMSLAGKPLKIVMLSAPIPAGGCNTLWKEWDQQYAVRQVPIARAPSDSSSYEQPRPVDDTSGSADKPDEQTDTNRATPTAELPGAEQVQSAAKVDESLPVTTSPDARGAIASAPAVTSSVATSSVRTTSVQTSTVPTSVIRTESAAPRSDVSPPPSTRQPASRAEADMATVLALLSTGRAFSGAGEQNGTRWPFDVTFQPSGAGRLMGELRLPTLRSVLRVHAETFGDTLVIRTTGYVLRGQAVVGSEYKLQKVPGANRLSGTWQYRQSSGPLWITLD